MANVPYTMVVHSLVLHNINTT